VVINNLLSNCGSLIEFDNEDQTSEWNAFGPPLESGYFRLHATQEYLDLATWREFHGFDMESTEVEVDLGVNAATLDLVLQVKGDLPRCQKQDGMERDLGGETRRDSITAPGPFAALASGAVEANVDPRR
jgi:hypothetical protein